ncbi:MAG: arginine N-succinyltransferase [Phycisphaerae bacterium]|nr:arginine N-succinyltransferase [Phycisphaerae bacterium]
MFVIRPAQPKDLPTLLKLARMVHFINLPADNDLLTTKVRKSLASFAGKAKSERDRQFMFVLEDTETENVVGTSAVISCISWPGFPHVYLKLGRREFVSRDLATGQVHTTLKFGIDESGPSEMGGLILAPGYRGHKEKLGALLSTVRFHFMGLHRAWFSMRVIAEMMGAVTPDSHTLLWEYLGRRFINLSYKEADLFSARSKEFMTSLFPREEIFASLLPPEARNLIGRVGEETEPAMALLQKQSFVETGRVDPFDGGPYLEAERDAIPLVVATTLKTLGGVTTNPTGIAIVSHEPKDDFRAIRAAYSLDGDTLYLAADAIEALSVRTGMKLGFTAPDAGPLAKETRAPKSAAKAVGKNKSKSRA